MASQPSGLSMKKFSLLFEQLSLVYGLIVSGM